MSVRVFSLTQLRVLPRSNRHPAAPNRPEITQGQGWPTFVRRVGDVRQGSSAASHALKRCLEAGETQPADLQLADWAPRTVLPIP
jgi:hypothetical protein